MPLHEQGFNYVLAEVLGECFPAMRTGDSIVAESPGSDGRGRVDIVVDIASMPMVAVECAFGGDDGKDAHSRISGDDARFETAIAINVPHGFQNMSPQEAKDALRNGSEIGYAVLQNKYRFPRDGYVDGSVRELAAFMHVASVSKDKVSDVADKIEGRINGAAASLASRLPKRNVNSIMHRMSQRSPLTGMRTIAVLWLDALLAQHKISAADPGIAQLPKPSPPTPPSFFAQEWRKILLCNWRSIFEPAVDTLEDAMKAYSKTVSEALSLLLECVEELNIARLGAHINVGAELFPKISEDRKQAAAFYTMPATAELLATLAINARDRDDFGDADLFKHMKIADFACGTGTLLRASLHRVANLHAAAGGDADSLDCIYRDSMEGGLTGADVSPIASHLSVSSLVLTGNGKPYKEPNIGWVGVGHPIGDKMHGCSTGSLEFLMSNSVADVFGASYARRHRGDNGDDAGNLIFASDASMDYVLMNPPYSRTRGGQSAFDIAGLSAEERDGCQQRWGRMTRNLPASKKAGMAASFLVLARNKLKPGGKLGFVLPLTAAFAQSWEKTRAMLVTEFENIMAIAVPGSSGGVENMSADTHMSEILLVASKRKQQNGSGKISPVLCIALDQLPARSGEAGEYARMIMQAVQAMTNSHCTITAGKSQLGHAVYFLPQEAGSPWSQLSVNNAEVGAIALKLAKGVLEDLLRHQQWQFHCPMTTLDELFAVGPTHHLIGHPREGDGPGAFMFDEIQKESDLFGRDRALWSADSKTQTRLQVMPTHKGVVADAKQAKRIREQAGILHYARNVRWTSQKLIAATTPFPVYGGRAWTTLLSDDENLRHAFALYANSAFGAMVHWTRGQRQQQGRSQVQVNAIKQMPCPDLRQAAPDKLAAAAKVFAKLADKELLPLCQLHADPVRHEIDAAAADLLGIPHDAQMLSALRRLWCLEPSVHGGNQTALAMLEAAAKRE